MIEYRFELNEEQIKETSRFRDKWNAIGLDCTPADRPKAENAVIDLYKVCGYRPPAKIVWADSPYAMIQKALEDEQRCDGKYSKDQYAKRWLMAVHRCVYGQHDAYWLAYYDFAAWCGTILEMDKVRAFSALATTAGWLCPYEEVAYVCERTKKVTLDAQDRPSCIDGTCIEYPDGWGCYLIDGVRVPKWITLEPHKITAEAIGSENNAEVRRIMIRMFPGGMAGYLKAVGSKVIDHDERWGTLHKINNKDDNPILLLEVVNRTREQDGTFKHYTLPVHHELLPLTEDGVIRGKPQKLTARNAVASTFGMRGEEYKPVIET